MFSSNSNKHGCAVCSLHRCSTVSSSAYPRLCQGREKYTYKRGIRNDYFEITIDHWTLRGGNSRGAHRGTRKSRAIGRYDPATAVVSPGAVLYKQSGGVESVPIGTAARSHGAVGGGGPGRAADVRRNLDYGDDRARGSCRPPAA